MVWIDILTIVILVTTTIKGWIRGFILSFLSILSFIISGIAAKTYYPEISKYIMGNSTLAIKIQDIIDKNRIYGEGKIIDLISIMILFFLVRVLFSIIGSILNKIAKLPILKECNHLGGMVFGFLKGLFIIFIFLTLITPLITMGSHGAFVEQLQSSTITQYLYNMNPIIGWIKE